VDKIKINTNDFGHGCRGVVVYFDILRESRGEYRKKKDYCFEICR